MNVTDTLEDIAKQLLLLSKTRLADAPDDLQNGVERLAIGCAKASGVARLLKAGGAKPDEMTSTEALAEEIRMAFGPDAERLDRMQPPRSAVQIAIARAAVRDFGESQNETLVEFLSCEAFESRFDPVRSASFGLAARLIALLLEEHAELEKRREDERKNAARRRAQEEKAR